MTELLISIPALPPKECHPNWRGHWAAKYRASQVYKQMVYICAWEARREAQWKAPDKADVKLTFHLKGKRKHDLDNLISAFKAGLDSLVIAQVIKDDDDQHITLAAEVVRGTEDYVEVLVKEDR